MGRCANFGTAKRFPSNLLTSVKLLLKSYTRIREPVASYWVSTDTEEAVVLTQRWGKRWVLPQKTKSEETAIPVTDNQNYGLSCPGTPGKKWRSEGSKGQPENRVGIKGINSQSLKNRFSERKQTWKVALWWREEYLRSESPRVWPLSGLLRWCGEEGPRHQGDGHSKLGCQMSPQSSAAQARSPKEIRRQLQLRADARHPHPHHQKPFFMFLLVSEHLQNPKIL